MPKGPIIIIDDDLEDLELIKEGFGQLQIENEIIAFVDGYEFLEYISLSSAKPFFILCDINMGKIGGLSLQKKIADDPRLKMKCIPFIFFSTSRASRSVLEAYSHNVQGYFIKPNNMSKMKEMFQGMITYWKNSEHPVA